MKTVAITGAASGIGEATARRFAREGYALALSDRDAQGLEAVAEALRAQGTRVHAQVVDVAQETELAAWAEALSTEFEHLDVLVNNAGISIYGDFHVMRDDEFERVMDINFRAVVRGTRLLLPMLSTAPRGTIVNISSLFGIIGVPGQTAYCASKFAVRGFSEALREELRHQGMHVVCVHPGAIRTRILDNATYAQELEGGDALEKTKALFARMGTSPSVVADRIHRAVVRKEPRVLVTRETHIMDTLARLTPSAVSNWAQRLSAMGGVRYQPGRR